MNRFSTLAILAIAILGGCTQAPPKQPVQVQALHGGSGTPTYPPFPVSGTKQDGYVPTVQADNSSVAWEAGGGASGSLADLSNVSDTLTGDTGDILSFDGTDWDDQTLEEVFTQGIGNGTNNYVLTTDGAGVIGWEAATGGTAATTPDGLTNVTRLPTFNVVDYGAGTTINNATLDGSEAAGQTNIEVDTGQGVNFAEDNSVVIPGAGAAHAWAAVTPTAPSVTPGQGQVVTISTSTDLITSATYLASIATGDEVIFYWTSTAPTVTTPMAGTALVEGTSYYVRKGTTEKTYSLHPTSLDATNNTNAYNFDGAGAATITMARVGATSYSYQVVALSGAGGKTIESSAGTTTTGHSTLSVTAPNIIDFAPVTDGSTNARGYEIYGRTAGSIRFLTAMNGAPNAMLVTHQAGGYTNCVPTDIGKQVRYSSANRGQLVRYDNASRIWIVYLDDRDAQTFPASSACTILNGEGVGTVTGTSTPHYVWRDCGDSDSDYDYPTWVWRTGFEVQQVQISSTPTTGTQEWCWGGYQVSVVYNADAATVQAALRLIPRLKGVVVTTTGSTPNFTYTINYHYIDDYGLGDVPEIKMYLVSSGLAETIPTVWTSTQGKNFKAGDMVLHPATTSGVFYEAIWTGHNHAGGLAAPTFVSTINGICTDQRQIKWMRVPFGHRHAVPPGAATADDYHGTITGVSSDNLTVDPATTTTVPDDTGVFRDDLPAYQAAHAAAVASGGGVVTSPTANAKWYARHGGAEWKTIAGSNKALFVTFSSSSAANAPIAWNLNGTTVRFYNDQVDAYRYDITAESLGTYSVVNFLQNDRFAMRDFRFVHIGASEPCAQNENSKHNFGFGQNTTGDSLNDTATEWLVDKVTLIGLPNGLGVHQTQSQSPAVGVTLRDSHIWYGGCGHDAGGPIGHVSNTWIFGWNGPYRSTCLYTSEATDDPIKWVNVNVIDAGVDGIRIRTPNFSWQGGSFVTYKDNNLSNALLADSFAFDSKISDVFWNTATDALYTITAKNFILDNCHFRNPKINLVGDSSALIDCDIITNDWATVAGSSGAAAIAISGGTGVRVIGNVLNGQDVMSDATVQSEIEGISITGGTAPIVSNNVIRSSGEVLTISSGLTSNLLLSDNKFYSRDVEHNSNNYHASMQPGNGAYITYRNNEWDGLTKTDLIFIGGTSSATHDFQGDTFKQDGQVHANLTGTIRFKLCNFDDATNSWAFQDVGTIIEDSEFAILPTLTGATLNPKNNKLAGSRSATMAALASGVNNDVALPITDQVRLDPNAANSTVTSFVACADGVEKTIICTDAGAATITIDSSAATGTAANKIMCPGDTDIVMSTGERIVIRYDATTSLWYVIGGQYVAMDWQGGAIQLWQQGEQFNQPATREWALAA